MDSKLWIDNLLESVTVKIKGALAQTQKQKNYT